LGWKQKCFRDSLESSESMVKVLSLSTVYPNPAEENLGPFVRHRLQQVAQFLDVQVVAPVALIDYAARRVTRPGIPAIRQDGSLLVHYPRWAYLPGGGYTSAFFLAARLIPLLRKIRRKYPFDVLDSHFAYPAGISAALIGAALNLPFSVTLRGNEIMHARSRGTGRWIRWALERASRIIAVSENLRRFAIANGVQEGRVRTIPNGVDAQVFYPRPYAETRARLGIPKRRSAIVSAGFLIERKGHHRVVLALREIRRRGIDAELWIVGGPGREGQFESKISSAVRETGLEAAVHFTGNVAPAVLADYMSAADVLCLASSREGWPNVIHEAQACGAPVVATDVGGVQEMIPRAEYGFVVPANDQDALTAALGRALETRWDRAGITAWGQARSWRQVGLETAEALTQAASGRDHS
jgi:teichuronic acid biosynthesis glycosyltransferase TuaC